MLHARLRAAAGTSVDEVAEFVSVAHSAFDAASLSLTDNDPVSTWTNVGTTGGDAMATSTARPTYIASGVNSQPALRFDGSNDTMATAAFASALSQPNTLIVVAKSDTGIGDQRVTNGITSSDRHIIFAEGSSLWALYAGEFLRAGSADSNWHIFVSIFNTTSSQLYIDGGSAAATGNAGSNALTGLRISGDFNGGGNLWDGDMHFIGLYDGNLIADDLTQLNATCQALADRIGTTWTDIA